MITMESVEALKQPTQFLCAEEDAQWPAEFKDNVEKVGVKLAMAAGALVLAELHGTSWRRASAGGCAAALANISGV